MIQPEALQKDEPLFWSPGKGADVWEMFCAAGSGDLETIKRLLAKAPSLAPSQYEYRPPLSFAVRENRLEVAAYLLEHGATFDFGNLLEMASDRGYAEMHSLLATALGISPDPATDGEVIAAAIRAHDLSKVRDLLSSSPTFIQAKDARTNQPIHWAVMTRQLDVIDELLTRGADINSRRKDGALPIQLSNGDYHFRGWRDVPRDWSTTPADVRAHLRARGATVDICTACFMGDLERVRELLVRDPSLANR